MPSCAAVSAISARTFFSALAALVRVRRQIALHAPGLMEDGVEPQLGLLRLSQLRNRDVQALGEGEDLEGRVRHVHGEAPQRLRLAPQPRVDREQRFRHVRIEDGRHIGRPVRQHKRLIGRLLLAGPEVRQQRPRDRRQCVELLAGQQDIGGGILPELMDSPGGVPEHHVNGVDGFFEVGRGL